MDEECRGFCTEEGIEEIQFPKKDRDGVWESELEKFRKRLMLPYEKKEKCTRCYESRINRSGRCILCAIKGN